MEEAKLDIMAPKGDQLRILISYLEGAAKSKKGREKELLITTRTRVLIDRYMHGWRDLFNRKGMTAEGAFMYYRALIKEDK